MSLDGLSLSGGIGMVVIVKCSITHSKTMAEAKAIYGDARTPIFEMEAVNGWLKIGLE